MKLYGSKAQPVPTTPSSGADFMSYRRVKSAVALVVSATAGYLLALRGLPSAPRPADAHQLELAPSEPIGHPAFLTHLETMDSRSRGAAVRSMAV